MLANLRRKIGLASQPSTPQPVTVPPATGPDGTLVVPSAFVDNSGTALHPLTTEDLGSAWRTDGELFSPSAIPVWLQEQVGFVLLNAVSYEFTI